MDEYVKDMFSSMNSVCDDDNMRDTLCYDLEFKCLSSKTTLVLSNTRELNRVSKTKVVYLIYYSPWSVLTTVHPTLNDHEYCMRPACVVHAV